MSRSLRLLSLFWLATCFLLGGFGVYQTHSGNPEGGVAPAILIGFLTAPIGILIFVAWAAIAEVASSFGTIISLKSDAFIYFAMIGAGYWQWFVLLPKLIGKLKQNRSPAAWGVAAIFLLAILYGLYRFYHHVFPSSHL